MVVTEREREKESFTSKIALKMISKCCLSENHLQTVNGSNIMDSKRSSVCMTTVKTSFFASNVLHGLLRMLMLRNSRKLISLEIYWVSTKVRG